jgi:hypothetical protein
MAWDAEELPLAALRERVRRVQAAMAAAGQDGLLLYTNFVRSGAVSYLTGFSPYWADGVLLVPRAGEPVFATTLSKRVGSWIQSVMPVGELVTSPTPGAVLAKRLTAGDVRRLGVLELDAFPSGLYDELATALPGVVIVDGSETFAAARALLDGAERRLLEMAETIARRSLAGGNIAAAADVGSAVGAVERQARLQGAEEVYVAIAPDLDADRNFLRLSGGKALGGRFALRATVAYKGTWVRSVQTYARDESGALAIRRADAWFKQALAGIDREQALHVQITAAMDNLSGASLTRWMAEAAIGTRPLAAIAPSEDPGAVPPRVPAFVLTLGLTVDGVPWCGAGLARLAEPSA